MSVSAPVCLPASVPAIAGVPAPVGVLVPEPLPEGLPAPESVHVPMTDLPSVPITAVTT